jgi:crotonobetainyl-CoA:carnitine CoA-transferase CaiB-like acyl-CoA transferase
MKDRPNAHAAPVRPLSGVRVVEACSYVAGPWAAMMLSDLGADVIKIEPPAGDPYRSFGHGKQGLSAVWTSSNRGKKSVALDLKTDDGRADLQELLQTADVFVENWRPSVAAALRLDHEALQKINPRLIHVSITGYGDSGHLAGDPAYDALIQGRTGIVAYPGHGSRPDATPFFIIDKVTAAFAAQAMLAALFKRATHGMVDHVKLSMLDTGAYFNFPDMFQHRTFIGDEAKWRPPPSTAIATQDGWIVLSPVTGQQLGKTLDVIGRPEWKDDFKKIRDRVEMAHQFFTRLGPVMKTRTSEDWIAQFKSVDVPVGPVHDADQHFGDAQVRNNRIYGVSESPVGPVRVVRYPAIFGSNLLEPRSPAPKLGEHNGQLLRDKLPSR